MVSFVQQKEFYPSIHIHFAVNRMKCKSFQIFRVNTINFIHQFFIDACLQCAAVCNHCANSCTQEDDVKMMAKCIQLDMECATICYSAAQLMSMGSQQAAQICAICEEICEACGNECGKHDTEHCKECSRICMLCAEECRKMAA